MLAKLTLCLQTFTNCMELQLCMGTGFWSNPIPTCPRTPQIHLTHSQDILFRHGSITFLSITIKLQLHRNAICKMQFQLQLHSITFKSITLTITILSITITITFYRLILVLLLINSMPIPRHILTALRTARRHWNIYFVIT